MENEEKLVEEVFNLVKDFEGNVTELLETVARKVENYQSEISKNNRKNNAEEIKKLAQEIFEICPGANFIPVAIETESEKDFTTNPDFDEIWNYCYDYLSEKGNNEYGLEMPTQQDDITFGEWKTLLDKWRKMVELAGYKYTVSHDGDYCYDFHLNVMGFVKKSQEIDEFYDINR